MVPDAANASARTHICHFCALIIGIPIGIWGSQQATARKIINPLLDLMQTMPAFVYLMPAIFFFNIGVVPGVVASVIFSMPPTIRLTMLGIEQVPKDLIEATEAFGSTTWQTVEQSANSACQTDNYGRCQSKHYAFLIHGCYRFNGWCTRAW